MASALNTKINSYSLQRGLELSETVSASPTRTGTNTSSAMTTLGTTYEAAVGPIGGAGSWKFDYTTSTSTNGYLRSGNTGSSGEYSGTSDQDYSTGFWFKLNNLPTGTSNQALSLAQLQVTTTAGYGVWVSGSTAGIPNSITVQSGNGGVITGLSTTLSTGVWYYLALRRTTTRIYIYLNGTELGNFATAGPIAPNNWFLGGYLLASSSAGSVNISNYYLTTSTAIGPTQISEIWTSGSTSSVVNKTITETPATASALMTDPTIVIVANDHVEVTTSILVSATFPQNVTAGGDRNVNNVITEVLTASIQLVGTIDIATGSDISHTADLMTA